MHSPLDIATTGATQIWTINKPEVGNAITDVEFVEAFEAAVDAANADLGRSGRSS